MALPASASQIVGKNGRPESQPVGIAPSLGTAAGYAVLGNSTITNTGLSIINGNLGLSPGTSVTGFPPGIVNGTQHVTDAAAGQAQLDLGTAYTNLSQTIDVDLTGQNLGGLTLIPGVYGFSSSAQLTGTLTLNAQGDPNSVFIFLIGSTLTTASNSIVHVINGGSNCNVFWKVGSSATLGTATAFVGNILALTNITLNTSANVKGRLLARNGAVTLDTNNVSLPICSSTTTTLLSATTIIIGGNVTDTATVTGGAGVPTGTVIFEVSPDGITFFTLGVTKTLVGGVATSDSYTPLSAGTYYFQAVYSGDGDYPGSRSGNTAEPLVVNPLGPVKVASVTTTLLSATTITIGGNITDTATVTGGAGVPTGTVIFEVSPDGITFAALGVTKTLVGGVATSDSYTPALAGTYYFRAVYSGDASYNGSQSGNTAEPLVVNPLVPVKVASVTATLLSATTITIGDNITDTATVTGTGVTPTGTVIFKVSPDGITFAAFGATKTLNGSGHATSDSYTPALAGTYYFLAVYSGDANYNGSQSGNTAEPLVVNPLVPGKTASSTATLLSATTITVGDNITDTATVTGTGVTPTGTVIFKVSPDGVTFTAFGATKTLNGSGHATSDSYTPALAGTYYFLAVYSGDTNYNGSQSGNTAEPLIVLAAVIPVIPPVAGKADSATATLLSATTIITGGNITDTATVTSGAGGTPTGTVIFEVSPDGITFTALGTAKTLDGSGHATSDSNTPALAGTYYFLAVYSGDANYNSSQSANTAEPLVVVDPTPPPAPIPVPTPIPTPTPAPCPPVPCPCPSIIVPEPIAGIVTGAVASVPEPSGAANEYNLYIKIVSTGQMVWVAAKTTDFPTLLTVGTTLTGNLNHSRGWWILIK